MPMYHERRPFVANLLLSSKKAIYLLQLANSLMNLGWTTKVKPLAIIFSWTNFAPGISFFGMLPRHWIISIACRLGLFLAIVFF